VKLLKTKLFIKKKVILLSSMIKGSRLPSVAAVLKMARTVRKLPYFFFFINVDVRAGCG
jgi:hypothetical protein